MKLKTFIIAAAMSVSAGAAGAASVDFNVSKHWSSSGHNYGPVDVTGATMTHDGKIITNDEYVASWSGTHGGLGISSSRYVTYGTNERYGDQHTIDGEGKKEMALLDFGSKLVEITSVTFSYWDVCDDFDMALFTSLAPHSVASIFKTNIDTYGNGSPKTFYLTAGKMVGSMFGFGANHSSDQFKLKSITYREISEVPLPAGAVLLLSGLVGFGALRRRKNAG